MFLNQQCLMLLHRAVSYGTRHCSDFYLAQAMHDSALTSVWTLEDSIKLNIIIFE